MKEYRHSDLAAIPLGKATPTQIAAYLVSMHGMQVVLSVKDHTYVPDGLSADDLRTYARTLHRLADQRDVLRN